MSTFMHSAVSFGTPERCPRQAWEAAIGPISLHNAISAVFEGDCVSSHPSIPNPHERDRVLALQVRRGPRVRHSRESGNPLLRGGGPWAEALLLICGVRGW